MEKLQGSNDRFEEESRKCDMALNYVPTVKCEEIRKSSVV